MQAWESFFVAQVGASAALAGLLFVAVSINLQRILKFPYLPDLALESLLTLIAVLVLSSLLLVPAQPLTWLGIEVLGFGVIMWVGIAQQEVKQWRKTEAPYRGAGLIAGTIVSQLATLPVIVAGIVLLLQNPDGVYWVVPAILFAYGLALLNAWVLLVEINR